MGAADTEAALLAELQAEYAGMEAARKTYSEESQAVIKEQKLLMEALTTENAVRETPAQRSRPAQDRALPARRPRRPSRRS